MSNATRDLADQVTATTQELASARLCLEGLRGMIASANGPEFLAMWGAKAQTEQVAFLEEGLPGHLDGIARIEARLLHDKADLAAGKSSRPHAFASLMDLPQ